MVESSPDKLFAKLKCANRSENKQHKMSDLKKKIHLSRDSFIRIYILACFLPCESKAFSMSFDLKIRLRPISSVDRHDLRFNDICEGREKGQDASWCNRGFLSHSRRDSPRFLETSYSMLLPRRIGAENTRSCQERRSIASGDLSGEQ